MTRLVPHTDMTAAELLACSYQAGAILQLCGNTAWAIQNDSGDVDVLASAIASGLKMATELLAPVHDAIELHEGVKEEGAAVPEGEKRKQANEWLDSALRVAGDAQIDLADALKHFRETHR